MYAVRKKFHGPARLQSQNLVPLCDAPAAGAGDYCCCKSEQAQCRGLAGFAERPPDPGGNSGWPYAKPGLVGATQGPWSDKQSNIEREREGGWGENVGQKASPTQADRGFAQSLRWRFPPKCVMVYKCSVLGEL